MTPKKALAEVCRFAGSRVPEWTQANGSNVSVKDGETLWIKASGTRLDAAGIAGVTLGGWAALASEPLSDERYVEELRRATVLPGGRPSMETALHALLPGRWVVHLHSLAAIAMARAGEAAAVVPFALPGWELARAIAPLGDDDVILLANHGVILQDDGPPHRRDGVLARWRERELAFARSVSPALQRALEAPDLAAKAALIEALAPAPFRLYFPDAAVFADAMRACLVEGPTGRYRLREDAWDTDRDAAELWAATRLLQEACPELPELAPEVVAALNGMSLEKERRKAAVR